MVRDAAALPRRAAWRFRCPCRGRAASRRHSRFPRAAADAFGEVERQLRLAGAGRADDRERSSRLPDAGEVPHAVGRSPVQLLGRSRARLGQAGQHLEGRPAPGSGRAAGSGRRRHRRPARRRGPAARRRRPGRSRRGRLGVSVLAPSATTSTPIGSGDRVDLGAQLPAAGQRGVGVVVGCGRRGPARSASGRAWPAHPAGDQRAQRQRDRGDCAGAAAVRAGPARRRRSRRRCPRVSGPMTSSRGAGSDGDPARRQQGGRRQHRRRAGRPPRRRRSGEFGDQHRRRRNDRDGAQHATKLTSAPDGIARN